jgi:F0F1-type ATP synthase membrane subunit b/b'
MVGAGTFLNPLLKVVTTIAILAAVYFFLVRPILDTTEDISGGVLNSVNKGLSQAAKAQRQARQAEKQAQQQGAQSFEIQASGLSLKQAQRIQQCVHSAGQDVDALQACGQLANKLAGQ